MECQTDISLPLDFDLEAALGRRHLERQMYLLY